MNSSIKLLFVLAIASSCNFYYAQDDSTRLIIETNVDSAELFIDNNFFGIGRNFELNPDSGIHILQIVESIKKWDSEIIIDTILFDHSNDIFLTYDFKSQIPLQTNPDDIRVYEKDSLVGFTPILLEAGFTELKLEKPDYTSSYVTSEEISNDQIPELKYIGQPPKKQFFGSALFNILVGTAIALGATTAYYKLEADNNFDQYVITGDQELIDKVNQYDSISAATLVAMEISVGLIIYFFLSN